MKIRPYDAVQYRGKPRKIGDIIKDLDNREGEIVRDRWLKVDISKIEKIFKDQ